MQRLVKQLYSKYFYDKDRALYDFIFAPAYTQNKLDACLEKCDIEAIGGVKALLLSYVMLEHPELDFGDYATPRLKGLPDYFRFKNIRLQAHFSKIGQALNEADIPVLLFKGGALKIMHNGLPRPMGDIDILIPQAQLNKAIRICEQLGYHDGRTGSRHAIDLYTEKNESAVDLHHAVYEGGRNLYQFHKGLFERARKHSEYGVDFLLPSNEDTLSLTMGNLMKNLRERTSVNSVIFAPYDCRFLLASSQNFDWHIVHQNTHDTGMEMEMCFGARFLDMVAPGVLPDLDRHFPITPSIDQFCDQLIYNENYFMPLAEECRKILVVELKNYPWFFGRKIVKFLIMKYCRKHHAFVRWYLERQENRHAR